MQFGYPISKAHVHTHTNAHRPNIQHSLLRNLCIPSDLVKCFTATLTKTEKPLNDFCLYNLLSQIACLKWASSN
jgi:hypothetical protein